MGLNIYQQYSDQELLSLLNNGDHLAYTEIYDRYNGPLYLFAYKRIKSREEVKDVLHELFLKVWAEREHISPEVNLPAYLFVALRNKLLNIIAHHKIELKYIESFQAYATELQANNSTDYLIRHNQLNAFIEGEIAGLHPRMRTVFELSRRENMSRREIAEQLSISEETVKSHLHGALKILRLKLSTLFYTLFYLISIWL